LNSVRRLADALELQGQVREEFMAAAGRRLAGAAEPVPGVRSPSAGSVQIVPRQLPAVVRQFVGRQNELAALNSLLDSAAAGTPAVVISAIEGTAGIGKTALALHWAHSVAGRFPDGQLYVNLRGFDPSATPAEPAEAIRGFLDALGIVADRVPATPQAQAGLYRSLLADRRVLIVLDNARDVDQVRPLLPGSAGCLALVTSRARLAGLAVGEGAALLTLDVLAESEARQLLTGRLGAERVAAEPTAAGELIELCARLPLALSIAAARAASYPAFALAALAAELRDAAWRLDGLDAGDAASNIRAVFSWSYMSLGDHPRWMFRLLGLHAGPDITAPAAASLAGLPLPAARRAIGELASAHLLTEHSPGRYSFHDLLAAYAAEHACTSDAEETRREATRRILDHYLHTARAAAVLLAPARPRITLSPPEPGVTPEPVTDYQQALAWFEAEQQVLLAAVTRAAETGFDACAWQLPWAMTSFLDRRGRWHQQAAIQSTALAATVRLGDTAGQAAVRRLLATACARLRDYDQARAHLTSCLELNHQLGNPVGEARVYQTLAWTAVDQSQHADALGYAEQALVIFQAVGDLDGQADARNAVGWLHARLGNYQQASAFCRQALALQRHLGNPLGEAHCWDSVAYVGHLRGRYGHATICYRNALTLFRQLGDRYYEAETLTHLGDTRRAAGQPDDARETWRQALGILDDLGHPDAAQVRAKLLQLRQAWIPTS
jgi:tetratricopeptide (TPR) repeat protein